MIKEDFYIAEEIRYTKAQCVWLLKHLRQLQAGVWPGNDPELTGNMADPIVIGEGQSAGSRILYIPDKDAIRVGNEMVSRLGRCGRDGKILQEKITNQKSAKDIAEVFNLKRQTVYFYCHMALSYIQGRRKTIEYVNFKRRKENAKDRRV